MYPAAPPVADASAPPPPLIDLPAPPPPAPLASGWIRAEDAVVAHDLLAIELHADNAISSHFVEIRGGDEGPPLSSERHM